MEKICLEDANINEEEDNTNDKMEEASIHENRKLQERTELEKKVLKEIEFVDVKQELSIIDIKKEEEEVEVMEDVNFMEDDKEENTCEDELPEKNLISDYSIASKNSLLNKICMNAQETSDNILRKYDAIGHFQSNQEHNFFHECNEKTLTKRKGNKNVFECKLKPQNTKNDTSSSDSSDFNHDKVEQISFKGKLHQCSDCAYITTKKADLSRHSRTHTGERPFVCSSCDYRASQKSHLQDHIKIHIAEKPLKCSDCDFTAIRKSTLRNHFRVHTGEKLFRCNCCDFVAGKKSDILNHSKIHPGQKPFGCHECHYKTSDYSNLKRHFRIHTGEKPFGCHFCEYNSARKSDLSRHLKIHASDNKPFKCDVCAYATSENSNLKRHLRIHANLTQFQYRDSNYKNASVRLLNN